MKWLLPTWAIVVVLGAVAQAEPLITKQVAADAKWLVHADVDAMKDAAVPRTVGTILLGLPGAAENLKKFSYAIGMDPAEHLHNVTIYGWRYAEDRGVVVVQAEVNQPRLTAFLKTRPGYRAESYGDHTLMAWTENQGRKNEHATTGCFQRPNVMVFGRDPEEVRKALDVLDGSSPGLAEGGSLLAGQAPDGTMLEARALDLGDAKLPFKSPLVRKSKFLSVALGEHQSEAFAVARVVTESAEVANQVRAVLEGLLAMAELQFDSDPQMTKLVQAVIVSTNDETVTVECRGPADDAARLIKQAWANRRKLNRPR